MNTNATPVAPADETGKIKILHLKRFWSKLIAKRNGTLAQEAFSEEWSTDITLLNAVGLGIEQAYIQVYQNSPSFDDFENWILELNNGRIADERINTFNAALQGGMVRPEDETGKEDTLTKDDLAFWNEHGYVIIHDAVSKENVLAAEQTVWDFLDMDKNNSSTWYKPHPARQGIMVQFFQHPALQANRDAKKIQRAYEQLWGTSDLWVSTDRVSFNPPENESWKFPGPYLHWDVSLELPIPFGLQGLLYLADTDENQGAFTLVPGFQHRIDSWLNSLPTGTDPRKEDMYALGAKPIAGKAGDFIIWHQALPHGSGPNSALRPRIVQYINWQPVNPGIKQKWK